MLSPFERWHIRQRVGWSPRVSKGTPRLAYGHGWPYGEVADDEDGIFILHFVKQQGLGPRDFAHEGDTAPRREDRGVEELLLDGQEAPLRFRTVRDGIRGCIKWKLQDCDLGLVFESLHRQHLTPYQD